MTTGSASFARFSLLIVVFAASPLACATGAKSEEDRLLDEMSREIDGVQSETFAQHGDESPVDAAAPHTSATMRMDSPSMPSPDARSAPIPTPILPVVHLEPDGAEPRPILSLTNASLRPARAPHATVPARARRTQAKNEVHAEYGDPPAARPIARQEPPPSPAEPDAGLDLNDEDDEHLVRSDEDDEHIVGSE